MIQRQIKLSKPVSDCPTCGRQPHLYEQGPLFFIECSLCETRTTKADSVERAVMLWELPRAMGATV